LRVVCEYALAALYECLGAAVGLERRRVGLAGLGRRRLRVRLDEECAQTEKEPTPHAHAQVGELERRTLGRASVPVWKQVLLHASSLPASAAGRPLKAARRPLWEGPTPSPVLSKYDD